METIGWGRGTGKTTTMIKWWLEDPENRIVVCATFAMKRHALGMLNRLVLNLAPSTWHLAQHRFLAGTDKVRGFHGDIGADDYDRLPKDQRLELARLHNFKVYTVNGD